MTHQDGGQAPANTKPPYPKAAFFILAGYLLERFAYYGLFGGVVFYMQRVLGFSASSSSTIKASMEGLIYLAPIAGAILADTYLGKVRTICIMCCTYIIGAAVFTLSSASPLMTSLQGTQAAGIGGLLLLGLSAGLMKAVYTSLGPDQFVLPDQRREQERYFYAFYWMINAGAFLGQILTAQLRERIQCFEDDCYFLPFMIETGIMVLSATIFSLGRKRYIEAPPDTMLLKAIKCSARAVSKSYSKQKKPEDHWLDRAKDKYDMSTINDVKQTFSVLTLFVTFPLFWALFYQTSTGMVFQAKKLQDRVGSYIVPPEMTSAVNPLLILILIPLFDQVINPILNKYNLIKKVTSRMTTGMILAVVSFLSYSVVNMQVEQKIFSASEAGLRIYNNRECNSFFQIRSMQFDGIINPYDQQNIDSLEVLSSNTSVDIIFSESCGLSAAVEVGVELEGGKVSTLILLTEGFHLIKPTNGYLKNTDAEAKLRVVASNGNEESVVQLQYESLIVDVISLENYQIISPRNYSINLNTSVLGTADIRQDGVYDIVIENGTAMMYKMTAPSTASMLWLLPQYLLITVGEVLFSVSSIDFAYTEAPTAMKSVMQAANLFTITIGLWVFSALNAITSNINVFVYYPSYLALLYALFMAINAIVFYMMAKRFEKLKKEGKTEDALKCNTLSSPELDKYNSLSNKNV